MSDPLTPKSGARYLLEHEADEDRCARYRAAVITPEARFDYRAVLGTDGAVELSPVAAAAPAELEETLAMIARLTARSAAKKEEDGFSPWPHRVLRWRGPGRG